ncbi:hypothetical protein BJ138DRAFT_79858 [Hygrophoropsis aurantiaca]|uniref:Uncharacterized protein n=1 Tax=Hygrophoropsis aurantiaca TaxID=72124 RepID=A0ACB7ZS83_9AGAM|nr:hypothetical protein BJ138DRAFT_79858 [Hygrophoropsis aurantiaca]
MDRPGGIRTSNSLVPPYRRVSPSDVDSSSTLKSKSKSSVPFTSTCMFYVHILLEFTIRVHHTTRRSLIYRTQRHTHLMPCVSVDMQESALGSARCGRADAPKIFAGCIFPACLPSKQENDQRERHEGEAQCSSTVPDSCCLSPYAILVSDIPLGLSSAGPRGQGTDTGLHCDGTLCPIVPPCSLLTHLYVSIINHLLASVQIFSQPSLSESYLPTTSTFPKSRSSALDLRTGTYIAATSNRPRKPRGDGPQSSTRQALARVPSLVAAHPK